MPDHKRTAGVTIQHAAAQVDVRSEHLAHHVRVHLADLAVFLRQLVERTIVGAQHERIVVLGQRIGQHAVAVERAGQLADPLLQRMNARVDEYLLRQPCADPVEQHAVRVPALPTEKPLAAASAPGRHTGRQRVPAPWAS